MNKSSLINLFKSFFNREVPIALSGQDFLLQKVRLSMGFVWADEHSPQQSKALFELYEGFLSLKDHLNNVLKSKFSETELSYIRYKGVVDEVLSEALEHIFQYATAIKNDQPPKSNTLEYVGALYNKLKSLEKRFDDLSVLTDSKEPLMIDF